MFIAFMTIGDGVATWAPDLVLVPALNGYQIPSTVLTTPQAQQGYAAIQSVISAGGSGRGAFSTTFTSDVLDNGLLDLARGATTPQARAATREARAAARRPGGSIRGFCTEDETTTHPGSGKLPTWALIRSAASTAGRI